MFYSPLQMHFLCNIFSFLCTSCTLCEFLNKVILATDWLQIRVFQIDYFSIPELPWFLKFEGLSLLLSSPINLGISTICHFKFFKIDAALEKAGVQYCLIETP